MKSDIAEKLGSVPSASLGEGTLVGLCYADIVEPVERHVAVSGGIQEQTDVCSFVELRVSWILLWSIAGGPFPKEVDVGRTRGGQGLGFGVEDQTLLMRTIESAVPTVYDAQQKRSWSRQALCNAPAHTAVVGRQGERRRRRLHVFQRTKRRTGVWPPWECFRAGRAPADHFSPPPFLAGCKNDGCLCITSRLLP